MKKSMSIAAAGLLAITTIGLTAQSSSAAFTTRCVGEGGAVTIPGDLVVPAGEACFLDGTTIQGTVRVNAGADLVMEGVTVTGDVVVRSDAYLEANDSEVGGAVTARESFGNLLEASTVGGAVSSVSNESDFGFLIVEDSALGANVRATGGALDLVSSTVATQVQGLSAEYTDVHDTVVEGNLRVDSNELGSVVCDSEVYGVAQLRDNQTGVQLGGDRSQGALVDCDGSNYFGGNVQVSGNSGGVWVVDNIIRGNLTGNGNDPAPVGEGNRVRGQLGGQFADMGAPQAQLSARRVAERGAELREAAQERSEDAVERAEDAGSAF